MKVLFVGGLFSEKQKKEVYINSKTMPNMAANVHQWNIIDGLQSHVDIINPLFVGNYPKEYRKLYIPRTKWSHKKGSLDISPSTINLFGIKQIYRLFTLSAEIRKWIKRSNKQDIIIVYSLNTSFLCALRLAQLCNKKVKTCIIVPDLPYFYINNEGKNAIYRVLKTIDWKLMVKMIKRIDGFVLLTAQMKDMLHFGKKPFIVSEGVCSIEKRKIYKNISEKTITYTGTLDREFGVIELIENFMKCAEPDWILNIAGGGNAKKTIEEYCKKDRRIHFFGVLTNEEAKELQANSRILVNPRSSKEEFTKYSFPSKTMEYLKSGRPVLMYKLAGIPKEYDSYLLYFKDTTSESFQSGLIDLMKKSNAELDEIGARGREFVLNEKNSVVQGQKLTDFLKTLIFIDNDV